MPKIGQPAGNPKKGDPQRLYAGVLTSLEERLSRQGGANMKLSPDWVVGFVDGEGCFHVSINKHPELRTGYQVLPEFVIVQHKRDIQVLYALKRFFRCGVVRKNNGDRWCLRIRKLSCLEKVCEFFTKHPLKTKKNVDFIKFRRIVHKMLRGEHLTEGGLMEIIDIALQMNTQNREALLQVKRDLEVRTRYSPPPGESQG